MVFGDNCYFACDDGYEVNGNNVLTCQSDGTWNDSAPNCDLGKHNK